MSRWLAGAAAVAVAVITAACGAAGTGDGRVDGGVGQTRASTPEAVAIQREDLPAGFERCGYSGDIESYLGAVAEVDPQTHVSLTGTWERLKKAGATAGYAAFYGDSERACRNFILPVQERNFGTEEQHLADHPAIASSFVFRFPDRARAEAAFAADHFGQSQLKNEMAMDVAVGEESRLGPNAIAVATQGSPIQIRQAVWQKGAWNVLFRSAALDRQASENVTAAMHLRMG